MTVSQQTWRLVCLSCVAVMKSATSVCLWDSLKPVGNNEEVQDSEPNKNQKRKKEDFYMTHSVLVWRVCLSNAKWSESTEIFLNQKMWEHSLKQGLLWIATPLNWTQFCSILIWSFFKVLVRVEATVRQLKIKQTVLTSIHPNNCEQHLPMKHTILCYIMKEQVTIAVIKMWSGKIAAASLIILLR